jgi:ribosomal protein S18 acetylase RimI-like enzyme
MQIRALGTDDIELLCEAAEGLFDNPARPEAAWAFFANPLNHMVAALEGGSIVAFASGTVLLHPDKSPGLFVNEVGTRESHRRRGLATAVCRALFARARARGCKGIWLAAEPDNKPALALYRKLGGDERRFVGFGWDGVFGPS